MNRRSVILRPSVFEAVVVKLNGSFYVVDMKKDDISWTIEKTYNEFNFFQKSVSEHTVVMKAIFPADETDIKKRIPELNTWLKEFVDLINHIGPSGSFMLLFNAFFKVNDHSINAKMALHSNSMSCIFRRPPVTAALKSGHLFIVNRSSLMHPKSTTTTTGPQIASKSHSNGDDSRKRYFVLLDHLYYYDSEGLYLSKDPPRGCVRLDSYHVSRQVGVGGDASDRDNTAGTGKPNCSCEFTVFGMPDTMTCRASTVEEADAWYHTLLGFAELL